MSYRLFPLLILLLVVLPFQKLTAQKIDTIYFQKGDRVTGEVKGLENNQLRLSTDDASTIKIEWSKVDSVRILSTMRIVLSNGTILYGNLMTRGQDQGCFILQRIGNPRQVRLEEIVALSRLEDRVWSRIDGTLSSGFSYTKASDVMQVNINGAITYTAEKNQLNLSYDGIFTRDTEKKTQRQHGALTFRRLLPRKFFFGSTLSAENSTEQNLDLRTSFGLGLGNSLVYTNTTRFYIAGGIQGNREWSEGNSQYNLEGQVTLDYSVFIYDSPEISFNVSLDLIPSFSNLGRIRTQIDSNLKWEVFNDFYLKWNFFYNFDNKPLSETASKTDWAISLLGVEIKL